MVQHGWPAVDGGAEGRARESGTAGCSWCARCKPVLGTRRECKDDAAPVSQCAHTGGGRARAATSSGNARGIREDASQQHLGRGRQPSDNGGVACTPATEAHTFADVVSSHGSGGGGWEERACCARVAARGVDCSDTRRWGCLCNCECWQRHVHLSREWEGCCSSRRWGCL